jgi:hypothetical protein
MSDALPAGFVPISQASAEPSLPAGFVPVGQTAAATPTDAGSLQEAPTILEQVGHGAANVVARTKQLYYMATGDDANLQKVTQETNENNRLFQRGLQQGKIPQDDSIDTMLRITPGVGPAYSEWRASHQRTDVGTLAGEAGMMAPLALTGGGYVGALLAGGGGGALTYDPKPSLAGLGANTALGAVAGPVTKFAADMMVPAVAGAANWVARKLTPDATAAAPAASAAAAGAAVPSASSNVVAQSFGPRAGALSQDFETLGLPHTEGQVTRNPRQFAAEVRAAKIEGVGDPLLDVYTQQNAGLADVVPGLRRDVGSTIAPGPGSDFEAAKTALSAANTLSEQSQAGVRSMYDAAKTAAGATAEVPQAPIAAALGSIQQDFGKSWIPSDVQEMMRDYGWLGGTQIKSLDVTGAEQLRKIVGNNIDRTKPTSVAVGSRIQQALDDAVSSVSGAGDAGAAFQAARAAAHSRFSMLSPDPIASLIGETNAPTNYIGQRILRAQPEELAGALRSMAQANPRVIPDVQAATLDWIQNRAMSSNGTFLPGAYSDALDAIGPHRMAAIFEPDTIATLEAARRASLATLQPSPGASVGGLVNYSNTGSELANLLANRDTGPGIIGSAISHIPLVGKPLIAAQQAGQRAANATALRESVAQAANPGQQAAGLLSPQQVEALRVSVGRGMSPMAAMLLAQRATQFWRGTPPPQQ